MKNTTKVETQVGGKTLSFETGLLAQQANGAATAQLGDTVVFAAVTATKKPREGIDFFPLQIEYREKFYSAGRFPGGYFKREARPSEREILIMRVTDRPIRPLFPAGYHNDVQINAMVMSADGIHETDTLTMNLASTILTISEIPFQGPLGAVRMGRVNGEFVVEPTVQQMAESDLDLIYAGTREKTMMIEGEASEIKDEDLIAAMKLAHEAIVPIIDSQLKLRSDMGLPEKVYTAPEKDTALYDKAVEIGGDEMRAALTIAGKLERQDKLHEIRESLKTRLLEAFPDMEDETYFHLFDDLEIDMVRSNVLDHNRRIDGRELEQMRPLDADTGVLPLTHGSAMFSRGETQNIATVTLGTARDVQSMDAIVGGPTEKNFILHYNFPPYSVGEAGRLGMTSRREIGHGNLAERSLAKVMPKDYPYSVRVVSEIMSSNGSTSMASVCGGCLALMDAGVPITRPVAGISAGLFTRGDEDKAILDILGSEDHCGDMDFKVCGTTEGITGFQVDMKINGMTWAQVEKAFEVTKKGREEILAYMGTVLAAPRDDLAENAPRFEVLMIDPEKIGAVIGPGGKVIRGMTEEFGVQIDIDDTGKVSVFGLDKQSIEGALNHIHGLTAEAEVDVVYDGLVKATKDFGAFVEILPGIEGLVHISELENRRVEKVEDVLNVGDRVKVKCIGIDDRGKVKLSRKECLTDEDA